MKKKYGSKKKVGQVVKREKIKIKGREKSAPNSNYTYTTKEWDILKYTEQNYSKCHAELNEKATSALGLGEYEKHLGVPKKFCIMDLELKTVANRQKCAIPLRQEIADYLTYEARKEFLWENTIKHCGNAGSSNLYFNSNFQFFVSNCKYGIVTFALVTVDKPRSGNMKPYSISLYVLINGKEYMELCRYDYKNSVHYNRFEADGSISKEGVKISGPHMHKYSEKFTVLFPESFCHYDSEMLHANLEDREDQKIVIKSLLNMEQGTQQKCGIFTNLNKLFRKTQLNHLETADNNVILPR